jgi:hypothetical protein
MGRVIPLTTHNAEIKTATVEIRTLTVTGKQVTLAVFRQLREEPLINDDGTLNGVAWGTVNYCPGKTCPMPDHYPHWHVIWQQGVELKRSAIKKAVDEPRIFSASEDQCITADVCAAITGVRDWPNGFPLDGALAAARKEEHYHVKFYDTGIVVSVRLSPRLCELRSAVKKVDDALAHGKQCDEYLASEKARTEEDWRRCYGVASDKIQDRIASSEESAARAWKRVEEAALERDSILSWFEAEGYTNPASIEAWGNAAKKDRQAEVDRRARQSEARKAIASLPQLFIAV